MKNKTITSIIAVICICSVIAYMIWYAYRVDTVQAAETIATNVEPRYRAWYYETGETHQCNQVYWAVKGTICYVLIDGNLKSKGYGMLQMWTGLWDSNGTKIFEGDRVRNPNGTEGIVMFSDTDYTRSGAIGYYGWYIRNESGINYQFRDFGESPTQTLSTVIPHIGSQN